MCGFCNVWACVCVFRFFNVWVLVISTTLPEVFPCFFVSFKANVRLKLAKMWHGPHSS